VKALTRRLPVLLLLAFIGAFSSARGAILIVGNTQDSGAGSLRDTIAAGASGDTIGFNIPTSDPGYDPFTGIFTITLTSGEIVIQSDLTIANTSGAKIAISGNQVSRILHVMQGTVSISDLSFVNGRVAGAYGAQTGIGGAILNQGSLACTRCTFRDNSAVGGPGYSSCYFGTGPGGDAEGGAIANQATLSLVACTLAGNTATGGDGGINLCFPQFFPQDRGGKGTGGAICNEGGTSGLTLTNCTITGNTARSGNASAATVEARGGGVANFGGLTVVHSTVANNMTAGGNNGSASSGGGLYCAADSMAELGDTILAGNVAVGGNPGGVVTGPDVAGAVSSQGHNLLGRSDGCTGFTSDDLQGGTTDDTRLDPMLGPLGNNGGPTETLPLLPGSPAIDSGDTAARIRDQRNFVRSGLPDIGAFEYQGMQPVLLANISTRVRVQTGDNAMIGGLIVTGTDRKAVIVRGIGPSLPVPGALADPVIEVYGSAGQLFATNDNWRDGFYQQEVASTLPPPNDLESALWGILDPGAYTVVVRGNGDTTGVGLFEVYDLDQTSYSKLANISTRGLVDTGDNVLIGGTIITGNAPTRVIFRAIGPSLGNLGVPNALEDPTLELYDGNGQLIAMNYDWRDTQEAEIIATGIPPSNDLESAIVGNFTAGNYTAIVHGTDNTTGIALVEVYNLD
jgi:hypothetical protein